MNHFCANEQTDTIDMPELEIEESAKQNKQQESPVL